MPHKNNYQLTIAVLWLSNHDKKWSCKLAWFGDPDWVNMADDLSTDELVFVEILNLSRERYSPRVGGEEPLVDHTYCWHL